MEERIVEELEEIDDDDDYDCDDICGVCQDQILIFSYVMFNSIFLIFFLCYVYQHNQCLLA